MVSKGGYLAGVERCHHSIVLMGGFHFSESLKRRLFSIVLTKCQFVCVCVFEWVCVWCACVFSDFSWRSSTAAWTVMRSSLRRMAAGPP